MLWAPLSYCLLFICGSSAFFLAGSSIPRSRGSGGVAHSGPSMISSRSPLQRVRSLPTKVVAGYANWDRSAVHENQDAILHAARSGVNVLFWFAIDLVKDPVTGLPAVVNRGPPLETLVAVAGKLRAEGLTTTHLISIGGWNEVHPYMHAGAEAVYEAWKTWNEQLMARPAEGFFGFDGFDWDIEGNDDKASPYNHFSPECLEVMGEMSVLAKRDGYLVTMAPPESYLDPFTSDFSRSLRGTLPEWRELVPHFTYHGCNAYALLLAKFGKTQIASDATEDAKTLVDTFDLVIYQLYESYGHANHHIQVEKRDASAWLLDLVRRMQEGWLVRFGSDPDVAFQDSIVRVRPDQLVVGLANAWAHDSHKDSCVPGVRKALFLRPHQLQHAVAQLENQGTPLRGFAFWTLTHEGDAILAATASAPDATPASDDEEACSTPVSFWMAQELNAVMHTRP